MKYNVTCDNCGEQFLIEAEPGQTVSCVCPGCGGTMRLTLPLSASSQDDITVTPLRRPAAKESPGKKRNSVNPIMLGITLGFSILVVLAIILFTASHFADKPIEPASSGYIVDTVAVQPDYEFYELPPEPELAPEIDTVIVDEPQQETEMETRQEQEAETVVGDSI